MRSDERLVHLITLWKKKILEKQIEEIGQYIGSKKIKKTQEILHYAASVLSISLFSIDSNFYFPYSYTQWNWLTKLLKSDKPSGKRSDGEVLFWLSHTKDSPFDLFEIWWYYQSTYREGISWVCEINHWFSHEFKYRWKPMSMFFPNIIYIFAQTSYNAFNDVNFVLLKALYYVCAEI